MVKAWCIWCETGNQLGNNKYFWIHEECAHKLMGIHSQVRCIKEMLKGYDRIENYVSAENKLSIQWLEWCGFVLEEKEIMGIGKKYFHKFYMEGDI